MLLLGTGGAAGKFSSTHNTERLVGGIGVCRERVSVRNKKAGQARLFEKVRINLKLERILQANREVVGTDGVPTTTAELAEIFILCTHRNFRRDGV